MIYFKNSLTFCLCSATVVAAASDLVETFFHKAQMPQDTLYKVKLIAQANVILEVFQCFETFGLNPDIQRINRKFKDFHPQIWNMIQCHVYGHNKRHCYDWK